MCHTKVNWYFKPIIVFIPDEIMSNIIYLWQNTKQQCMLEKAPYKLFCLSLVLHIEHFIVVCSCMLYAECNQIDASTWGLTFGLNRDFFNRCLDAVTSTCLLATGLHKHCDYLKLCMYLVLLNSIHLILWGLAVTTTIYLISLIFVLIT